MPDGRPHPGAPSVNGMNDMTRSPSPARPASSARETTHAPTVPVPAAPGPTRRAKRRAAWLWPLLAIGAVLAVYLVGRGVAELILINYGDPASYAKDWGWPSLAGVLAVHSGPGLVIIATGAWWYCAAAAPGPDAVTCPVVASSLTPRR